MCGECSGRDAKERLRMYGLIGVFTLVVVLAIVAAGSLVNHSAASTKSCGGLSRAVRSYGRELTRDLQSKRRLQRDTARFLTEVRAGRLGGCGGLVAINRSAEAVIAPTCPRCARQLRKFRSMHG